MAIAKDAKVRALQLNIEGLIKLLGGTPEDRLRFWEITTGVTTRAEHILLNSQADLLQSLVDQVKGGAKTLKDTAKQIAKG